VVVTVLLIPFVFLVHIVFQYHFPPGEPPREYRDYLSYSLGDYQVVDVRRLQNGPADGPFGNWVIDWHLQYHNQYGEQMIFKIRWGGYHYNLVGDIFYNATSDAEKRMEQEIVSRFFPVIDKHAVISSEDRSMGVYVRWVDDKRGWGQNKEWYVHATEPYTGLNLSTVTTQELVLDWDCEFRVVVGSDSCDYDFRGLFESLEPMIRELCMYSKQENFEVSLGCRRGSCHSFKGYYIYNDRSDAYETELLKYQRVESRNMYVVWEE